MGEITKEILEAALKNIQGKAKEAVEVLKASRGIVAIAKSLIKIVPEVVAMVEEIGKKLGVKGAEKKGLAVSVLDALIPRPWWLSWMSDSVRKEIIGAAVDGAVAIFNRFWKK